MSDLTEREREERKLIERFWRAKTGKGGKLAASDKDWAFYHALLNAKPEAMLPVEVLS